MKFLSQKIINDIGKEKTAMVSWWRGKESINDRLYLQITLIKLMLDRYSNKKLLAKEGEGRIAIAEHSFPSGK